MTSLRHLRSSTANKRPDPTAMVDGQLAMNYDIASPGLFFKDDNGTLVKVGPVHVGTTAPNVSPAAGGTAGNSIGEQWLDTTGGVYVLKVWDGGAWRSESGTFVDVSGDTMTGALTMANQQAVRFSETTANGSNYIALQATTAIASNKTITLPDTTGTIVTTGDTGTVTSTMIENGTILNADVNASAAIAGTKVSPDFGSQTIVTTGVYSAAAGSAAAPSIAFTGAGIYSPGADQLAVSTGGTGRLFVDSSGRLLVGTSTAYQQFKNSVFNGSRIIVSGGDDNTSNINIHRNANDEFNAKLIISKARGSTYQSVLSGDILGSINFTGADNSGTVEAAAITAYVDGTTGANDMPGRLVFSTTADGSAASTERMRIDSSGNVMMGTSTPGKKLSVNAGNGDGILIRAGGYRTFGSNATLYLSGGTFDDGTGAGFAIASEQVSDGNHVLKFCSATADAGAINYAISTERIRIDSSGNSTFYGPIYTAPSSTTAGIYGPDEVNSIGNNTEFQLLRTRNGAGIWGFKGPSNNEGSLIFKTHSSQDSPIERMRIESGGNIRMISPTTAFNWGSATDQKWSISPNNTEFYIANGNFSKYAALISQNFTGWTFASDRRIKENIADLDYGIDQLKQIKARRFNFIGETTPSIGFIAQELKEVVPEAVAGTEIPFAEDDTQQEKASKTMGISKDTLIPVLVKALQEAIAKIETLEAKVAVLEGA